MPDYINNYNKFLKIFTEEVLIYKVNDNNKKYPVNEKQIFTEAVSFLQYTNQLSIKELREILKQIMDLSKEDLQINKNRSDIKFN